MNAPNLNSAFPVHSLPSKARDAAFEIQRNTGAPIELIVASLMAAMSVATQGLCKVKRLDGLIGNTSLWFLTLAESGERKSAVEGKTFSSIRDFERIKQAEFNEKMIAFEMNQLVWKSERTALLKEICQKTQNEDDVSSLKRRLEILAVNAPKKPRLPKIIYNDATQSALKKGLVENWKHIAIVSDEGAGIFNGSVISNLSLPNSLWSGSKITVDRADHSFSIEDATLAMSLQTQSGPLKRYFERKGVEARDTGFLARFLISYPISTQGNRYIYCASASWEHTDSFNNRIGELLEMSVSPDGDPIQPELLTFSPEAQKLWIAAYNEIENLMQPGQYFCNVRDYAAKIADNLARLAGIFHKFEGAEGPISWDVLERARLISVWYASEFVRLLSPPSHIPQEQQDAIELEVFFAHLIQKWNGTLKYKRNTLLQIAPNKLRKNSRFSVALDLLFAQGKIKFSKEGKTTWVTLNAQYFKQQIISLV